MAKGLKYYLWHLGTASECESPGIQMVRSELAKNKVNAQIRSALY